MNDVKITKLLPDDWQKYKEIRLRSLELEPVALHADRDELLKQSDEDWIEDVKRWADGGNQLMLFADDNGKLVGTIGVNFKNSPRFAHIATLYGMYVEPKQRGQGIGKKLINAMLQEIEKRSGVRKIKLSVAAPQISAINLYKSVGFEITGTAKGEAKFNDTYLDSYYMEKYLCLDKIYPK